MAQFASAAAGVFTCWPVSRCCERRSHRYPSTRFLSPLLHPPAMQGFPGCICDLAPRHMSSVWLKYILKKQLLKKLLLLLPLGGELPGSELLQLR